MFRNGFPGSFPTKKSNPLKRQATITHNVNNITKLNHFNMNLVKRDQIRGVTIFRLPEGHVLITEYCKIAVILCFFFRFCY